MPNLPIENAPTDMLVGRAIPPQAQLDFFVLSELSTDTCERVADTLRQLSPSEGRTPQEVMAGVLGADGGPTIAAILRLNQNIKLDELDTTLGTLERWVAASPDREAVFTAERLEILRRNAELIAQPFPIVELNAKANEVIRGVGNEYIHGRCFCDMRPVFDDARENVDAFVLLANLSLRYVTQSGDREVFELAMTEDELKELRAELDQALKKFEILKPIGDRLLNETKND